MRTNFSFVILTFFLGIMLMTSCQRDKAFGNFDYAAFKDSMNIENYDPLPDTSNLFDNSAFNPGVDSLNDLLVKIDTLWQIESDIITGKQVLRRVSSIRKRNTFNDSSALVENIRVLDSFLFRCGGVIPTNCKERDCSIYAEVVKIVQKLYLYLDGVLVDSFKVSTGVKGYETPDINTHPSGPLFMRYTSRKFPGGNYERLGNMPYAIFVKGGYAIHGTTPGNFSKLGTTASHGCIRLHPNNAKIFYELVKHAGLQNCWVKVTDTLRLQANN